MVKKLGTRAIIISTNLKLFGLKKKISLLYCLRKHYGIAENRATNRVGSKNQKQMQPLKECEMRMISGGNITSDPYEHANGRRAGAIAGEYYAIMNSWIRGLVVTS